MNKGEVLATVGDREITRKDVDMVLKNLNPQAAAQFRSEDGIKNLVRELANQELFYLDAIDAKLDENQDFLEEVEKMKSGVLKQYAINKLLSNITVNENEILEYYQANKDSFSSPSGVKASHILIDDLKTAEKVSAEIKEGLSFEEAASKYSKCPSSQQGGDLGFFSKGMMVPEFEEAAFGMEPEQISCPIKTQFGYHLIKVTEKRDPGIKPFNEVKDQLMNQLASQKQQQAYNNKVDELKDRYSIKINI